MFQRSDRKRKFSTGIRLVDSLQTRMAVATAILLLLAMTFFILASYFQNREQALDTAKDRLKVVAAQLSQMFSASAKSILSSSESLTKVKSIQQLLQDPAQEEIRQEATQELGKLHADSSSWPLVQVVDIDMKTILSVGSVGFVNSPFHFGISVDTISKDASGYIGGLIVKDSSLYYPIVMRVRDSLGGLTGYLIRWRLQQTSTQAYNQFASLLGEGVSFYVGNRDQTIWTDLRHQYTDQEVSDSIDLSVTSDIAGTAWMMRVGMNSQIVTAPVANRSFWLTGIAALVLIGGVGLAWSIGRRITRPLRQLVEATDLAAEGNYQVSIPINRRDELGQLGRSFKALLEKVRNNLETQERVVADRTAQLEQIIVQLRVSEDRFRGLLESAPDATIIVDKDGEIVLINKQAENVFGYSREELIGARVEQLIPQALREAHLSHRTGYFMEPKVRSMGVGMELFAVRKDGTSFPVEISLSPMHSASGMLVTAAVRDITERKLIEASLQQINRELESFTYSVSHDLRAPLRIIDGYADILLEDYQAQLDQGGVNVLHTIKNNARRMGRLIDDLLDLSRLGRKELEKTRIDMDKLVRRIISDQCERHQWTNVTIDVSNLPHANADESLIEQVWINLISNAAKYSSQKEAPKVEISANITPDEIIYVVKDNGVGFDMRYADKLFGVFQRLHKVTEFEGTGIGLALAHRIILRHRGRIWANAIPGEGATFYFSLPNDSSIK